ncbi:hypothetical protein BC828DRAFT_374175 [Blastocladiella britannica]|nr:hypothetical protein BC828DRAFT_374175 [Blastocladiella britannica]
MSRMTPACYAEAVTPSRVSVHFGDASPLSPLERVIFSSNGSLQRVLSALYNSDIDVVLVKNIARPSTPATTANAGNGSPEWCVDREINLVYEGKVVCVAKSALTITNPEYYDLLITQSVGIGQFFRRVGVLPAFDLLEFEKPAAPSDMWRLYSLSCPGVVCVIHETYPHWIADPSQCPTL